MSPGPSSATTANASTRLGKELMMSKTIRMTRSTARRKLGGGDAEQRADRRRRARSTEARCRARSARRRGCGSGDRGRDGRCRADAAGSGPAKRLTTSRRARRIGRDQRRKQRGDHGEHDEDEPIRPVGTAHDAAQASSFTASAAGSAAVRRRDARIEPGIGQVDDKVGQHEEEARRPARPPARRDSCAR